jgi:hypothetical protein
MTAPKYEWECPRCQHANASGTEICTACQCPASFQMKHIPKIKTDEISPLLNKEKQTIGQTVLIFFPEIIPAVVVAVGAPFWAFQYLSNGHFLNGLILLVTDVACVFFFFRSIRRGEKWMAYMFMVLLLLVAWAVSESIRR